MKKTNATKDGELEKFRESFIAAFERISLNTAPGDAMLLRILIESSRAKRGLEIGTATGYGAIVMGLAFERNGGRLLSLDFDAKMAEATRANIAAMKLEKTCSVRVGDAVKLIKALKGTFDFVFIDAEKSEYLAYFKALEGKLAAGALVVADNVIKHRKPMEDFLEYAGNHPGYHFTTLRASDLKGDGMAVMYKLQ